MSTRLKGDPRKVVTYFNKTKVFNQGFLKYGMFSKKIKYALDDLTSDYQTRKIFSELLERGYFNKKKNEKRSYLYQFKNKKNKVIVEEFKSITITFN
jgi:uncharacterized protein YfkK (UPF0435 family)